VLITRETRAPTLARKALSLAEAERLMRESQVRRLVLTLDACHAGVEIGRDLADPEFIHNAYELAEGFALIAASTAQQVAQEWEKKEHGVFTYYLLEGLSSQADRAGKGFVTVDDLKTHVLDGLRRWNVEHGGLLQEPTARTEGLGDIILADYRDRAHPAARPPIHLRTEGPETRMSSSEGRKLMKFTFAPPEPDDYRNWFSAVRRITEEGRANGDWTDNNGDKHRFRHLEHFVEPFCKGQVYDASFSLYSKDADGNFYEEVVVIVKVKPETELSFEVTDQTHAHRREKLADTIQREIGKLKGVRLISVGTLKEPSSRPAEGAGGKYNIAITSAQGVTIGNGAQVTQYLDAPPTGKVERGLNPAEERAFLEQELAQHKRNLYRLRGKKAKYGIDVPISILNQIEDEEQAIGRIEAELRRVGGDVL
jgi:hypothetical protein